jgi:L-alanine-DL-glutamate epimerase-like enolase superfamily enzyme
METQDNRWSRRSLFQAGSAALLAGAGVMGSGMEALAQARGRVRTKISDVQTMIVQGPGRNYVYVRVVTADGHTGIGEGYGSPGVAVAEQILALKPWLVGKDPLEIDKIYTMLGDGSPSLSGTRTDGSAHNLMRAASAIEMALWDLAGRMLDTPTALLLGGRFRQEVRVYDHSGPRDAMSKASCKEWADKVMAHPSGFTAHKIGIQRNGSIWAPPNERSPADNGVDVGNRHLSTQELRRIGQSFENMREAIGWDHDLAVHCHWNLDVASATMLAEVIAPMKPMWLEDPLPVDYTGAWTQLTARSPVPIHTGENLARREGFAPFIVNQGCHLINPDLRNSGGFLETKRIADLASLYGISTTTHNTASQLHTYQICQWATSIRDFVICETITGQGGWMDQIIKLDGPYIEKGYIKASDLPGTGVELNREVVQAHLAPGQKWWGDV